MRTKTISIIGVGLIGGSLGMALKGKYKITGIGRNVEKLKLAKNLGAIDEYTTDFAVGVKNADIVVVATPVDTIVPLVKKILPYIKAGCIITDVGSVKKTIADNIMYPDFVGSHPLAGTEKTGVKFASCEIFKNATVAITPAKNTSECAINVISKMWRSTEANILILSPEQHDKLVALTSHLPHILSSAFVDAVWRENKKNKNVSKLLAGSFRDFSRISDSDPAGWSAICSSNQKEIEKNLAAYIKILKKLKINKMLRFFSQAKNKRWQLLQSDQKKKSDTL